MDLVKVSGVVTPTKAMRLPPRTNTLTEGSTRSVVRRSTQLQDRYGKSASFMMALARSMP